VSCRQRKLFYSRDSRGPLASPRLAANSSDARARDRIRRPAASRGARLDRGARATRNAVATSPTAAERRRQLATVGDAGTMTTSDDDATREPTTTTTTTNDASTS